MNDKDVPRVIRWSSRRAIHTCGLPLVVALFGVARPALSLNPELVLPQYPSRTWDTRDGLVQNSVRSVTQTSDGYIWIATDGGLSRFDGARFTNYTPSTAPGLRNGAILTVKPSREGGLWIGTHGGLCRMRDGRFTFYGRAEGLPSDAVYQLQETRDGSVWLATSAGLVRFRAGQITAYTTRDGLPADRVTSVAEDPDGSLWIGYLVGLVHYHDGVFTTYTKKDGLPADRVEGLSIDRSGALWIGLNDIGVCRLRRGVFTHFLPENGPGGGAVYAIREDRDGLIWYTSTSRGLHRLDLRSGRSSTIGTAQGLVDDYLHNVFEDNEGNIWAGTQSAGVVRLTDARLTTYSQDEGLTGHAVQSVVQDRNGTIWAATRSRLSRFVEGRWLPAGPEALAGLGPTPVLFSLLADTHGRLWIGGVGGLIYRDAAGQSHRVAEISADTHALLEDREGRIWAGTTDGLVGLDGPHIQRYTTHDGLVNNDVRSLIQDKAGDLWLGTLGGGVTRLSKSGSVSYDTRSGLLGNGIRALYEDAEGAVWIGAAGVGLVRYHDGRFTTYRAEQGLREDSVDQILEDDAGFLWTCGARGVSRTSRRELSEIATGGRRTTTPRLFGASDGMKTPTCHNGTQPAALKARDGRLWFATLNGVTVVDPGAVEARPLPLPRVVLEEVIADGETLATSPVRVPAGRDNVEIHYTAPSFRVPEHVVFRYQLLGLDRDWVVAGPRRTAYYNRIPGGSYRFRVAAGRDDGTWNDDALSFDVEVEPRLHERRWFRAAVFLVVAAMLGAVHLLRLRQAQARMAAVISERTRIAGELHDTLLQSFSAMGFHLRALADTIVPSPDAARQQVETLIDDVSIRATEARRSIWALRSDALQSSTFPTALGRMVHQLTTGTSTNGRVEVQGSVDLSPAVEEQMLRIATEAVTNAVKHAAAGEIVVTLGEADGLLQMHVRDDGRGMDVRTDERANGHFGLSQMKDRARKIGASLHLESSPGKGTQVSVLLRRRAWSVSNLLSRHLWRSS